jgi:hypothetical protein
MNGEAVDIYIIKNVKIKKNHMVKFVLNVINVEDVINQY